MLKEGKVISARIPMENYIEVLKRATELKMTVSEYLIMKLFNDDIESKQLLDIMLQITSNKKVKEIIISESQLDNIQITPVLLKKILTHAKDSNK